MGAVTVTRSGDITSTARGISVVRTGSGAGDIRVGGSGGIQATNGAGIEAQMVDPFSTGGIFITRDGQITDG